MTTQQQPDSGTAPEGTEPTDQALAAPDDDAPDDTTKDGKAGAEAAKYRTRLRAAEAEHDTIASARDQLRERLQHAATRRRRADSRRRRNE